MMQYQGRTDNCAIQKIFGKLILPYQAVAVPEIVPSALWLWLWLRYNTDKLINWWLIAYGGREAVTAGLPVPSWFPRTFEHARGHRVKTSSFLYLFWYVFFFFGCSSLSFDGNCYVLRHLWVFLGRLLKDLFNSSCCFYLGCCRLPQQKRRSKIHPRLQNFFIPGWFLHYSLKTTRGIFWHTVNPFLLFFSHDSVC